MLPLSSLTVNVLIIQQFQRAACATDLQLRAVFTFGFHVFSVSYFNRERVIPDFLPLVHKNVSEAFEVALTRVNITVWSDAHVYHGSRAGFDA